MPATEIYRTVLSAVVAESEIPESKILSACRERDAVDARYVLVYVLYRIGFSSNRIERHTAVNLRSIQYIITYYEQRCRQSKFLRNISEAVLRKLRANSELSHL